MKEELPLEIVLERLEALAKQMQEVNHLLESLRRASARNESAALSNNKELMQMNSDSNQVMGKVLLIVVAGLGLLAGIALLRDSGMDITYKDLGIKAPQRTPRSVETPEHP